jgi:hypothetical protein
MPCRPEETLGLTRQRIWTRTGATPGPGPLLRGRFALSAMMVMACRDSLRISWLVLLLERIRSDQIRSDRVQISDVLWHGRWMMTKNLTAFSEWSNNVVGPDG